MKEINLNAMNDSYIQMFLQLISIPGCDSRSWTISVWPFSEAKLNEVQVNIAIQFNFINEIKLRYHERSELQFYEWFWYLNVSTVDFDTWLWE